MGIEGYVVSETRYYFKVMDLTISERVHAPSVFFFIFGCRTLKNPPQVLSTVECSRCWPWHHTQIYASSLVYRLYGSFVHPEKDHGNQFAVQSEHNCPLCCIYCHGSHTADDFYCKLHPIFWGPAKTKTQFAATRKIFAKARIQC